MLVLLGSSSGCFSRSYPRPVDIDAVVGVEPAKMRLEVVADLPVQGVEPLGTIESQPFNCPLTFALQGFISI